MPSQSGTHPNMCFSTGSEQEISNQFHDNNSTTVNKHQTKSEI